MLACCLRLRTRGEQLSRAAGTDAMLPAQELHRLLEDRELAKVPILVLANKIDLGPKISERALIQGAPAACNH